jgi:hypothetical protein
MIVLFIGFTMLLARLQLLIHQEMCQPVFGRRGVTKLHSGLPFCHTDGTAIDFSAVLFGKSKKVYYICIPIRHCAVEWWM